MEKKQIDEIPVYVAPKDSVRLDNGADPSHICSIVGGGVAGTIYDSAGAVVPNATVTLVNIATKTLVRWLRQQLRVDIVSRH